jgi:hypothetical protein
MQSGLLHFVDMTGLQGCCVQSCIMLFTAVAFNMRDIVLQQAPAVQAQRHQMLQARLGLQEQQMVVQKQAQQLHQATQRLPAALPGISAQAQSVAPAASAPLNNAAPAATPPAAQPSPPSAMQS